MEYAKFLFRGVGGDLSHCDGKSMLSVPSRLSAIDVLVAVANHRDLPAFVEHLNAGGANTVSAGSVLASVADTGYLLMHRADEPSALCTLHPVGLCAR